MRLASDRAGVSPRPFSLQEPGLPVSLHCCCVSAVLLPGVGSALLPRACKIRVLMDCGRKNETLKSGISWEEGEPFRGRQETCDNRSG